ncbi:MAG TPA: Yip1 family protein [Sphingomonas sp.]|nr:Yip1 family protein [Sphingomonas sp.]
MATQFDDRTPAGMGGRIKRIIMAPKAEWPVIDTETTSVRALMTGWAVPLAAIGPVARLIGEQVFGYNILGFHFRPTIASSVGSAVTSYILSLIGVWVFALIIDALAPSFGGVKNPVQAMKVAVYSWTAAWIAGIFAIVPALAFLMILGLYSFYLLYLGLPMLMKAPPEKALGYTIVSIVAAIVVFIVIGAAAGAITHQFAAPPALGVGSLSLH